MRIMFFFRFVLWAVGIMLFTACGSARHSLLFAGHKWHINDNGWAVNEDSTLQFTFGNILVDRNMKIYGSVDSLRNHPHLENYVGEILSLARLDSARILFFAPSMPEMFVVLPENDIAPRPVSATFGMSGDHTYTMWTNDDYTEEWVRRPDEIYTNLYFDKRRRLLVIVDRFTYGDIPMARIQRIQTRTKRFAKMFPGREVDWTKLDLTKPVHLEIISNWIDNHRERTKGNYKIGQKLGKR